MTSPDEILEFWFGANPDDAVACGKAKAKLWWKKSQETDAEITTRFGEALEMAKRGELDTWTESARGCAALIIVLDQFSRVIYRGTPDAWAQDDQAQALNLRTLESGKFDELLPIQQNFVLMPLMHAESRGLQDRSVEAFHSLAERAGPDQRAPFDNYSKYADQHRDIVARFGRFPHRNAILGRESTAEELEFLSGPGSSF